MARDLDTSFTAGVSGGLNLTSIRGLAFQLDGKILVCGEFNHLSGHPTIGVGRLNPDGSADTNFTANAATDVFALSVQSDGKILIGGAFTTVDGQTQRFLGRLNTDGTWDPSFITRPDQRVRGMALQKDGNIIIVGDFTAVDEAPHQRIARINADGVVDASFNPAANITVWTAAAQADGKILVGGAFTNLSGAARSRLGRFNSNGSLDTSFNPGIDYNATPQVNALTVQPDGKILVGGAFTSLAGQFRRSLGRLNSDGSLDTSFDPSNALAGAVTSIVLQSDGGIIVASGNNAYQVDPASGQVTALLTPQADNLLRSLALQRDGQLLVAGNFTTVSGAAHSRIARLRSGDEPDEILDVDASGSTVTWSRIGSGPEVAHVAFERSFNGVDYTSIGIPIHIAGGWQLTGLSLPTGEFMFLRARGWAMGGLFNGSSSWIESVKQFSGILGPQLRPPTNLGNGAIQLEFFHDRGVNFSIFAATNLSVSFSNWTEIGSPTSLGNGVFRFTDTEAATYPQRFYQLRTPPPAAVSPLNK